MVAESPSLWSVLPLMRDGFEIVEVPVLGRHPPRQEPERFSGGINLSAVERNHHRLNDALRVYGFSAEPRKLFCAPWVAALLRAAARGEIPGVAT